MKFSKIKNAVQLFLSKTLIQIYHENFKKYQILTHPDEWFESSNTQHQNYHLTYRAHCENFNKTMQAENNLLGSWVSRSRWKTIDMVANVIALRVSRSFDNYGAECLALGPD